jgi:hypothetical protein
MFELLQIKLFVFIFQILDRYLVFLKMQKVLYGSMNAHTKFGVSVWWWRRGRYCRQIECNCKFKNVFHQV